MSNSIGNSPQIEIHLAPMEGTVDYVVRKLWTTLGGYDLCLTEFIRVTTQLIPEHVFYRYAPELQVSQNGSRTTAGVPLMIQLLGGDPQCLAENAAQAAALGAFGIDLNFGCPAPTVNRHDGGATLLKCPERIFKIVEAVRAAVPKEKPVTAKIRLGFADTSLCLENAQAVAQAGADRLTVHCRTKLDFYRPPAFWEWIPRIQSLVQIPVVANGEIWTVDDFEKCIRETGASAVMLGRGAISNPFLAKEIRGRGHATWSEILLILRQFFDESAHYRNVNYAVDRSKQWLRYLQRSFPEAAETFLRMRVITDPKIFRAELESQLSTCRQEECLSL